MAGDSHRAKGQRRPVESSSRCHRANAAAARGDLGELKSIATHRQYLMNIERYVKNPIARLWCVDYNLILSRYKNLNQKEHRDEARRWWNTQLQSIMQVVDESVCGQVPDNVYKQLCEELKVAHDIVN